MKLKKLTLIAALAMFSLSGAANAMLPLMLLLMGPMMGDGMMGLGGHGGSAQGASSAEGHDHAGGKAANSAGGNAASGEHGHDSAAGTPGVIGPAGADRPSAEGVGSGRMMPATSATDPQRVARAGRSVCGRRVGLPAGDPARKE